LKEKKKGRHLPMRVFHRLSCKHKSKTCKVTAILMEEVQATYRLLSTPLYGRMARNFRRLSTNDHHKFLNAC
jgi:hypothetical protein